VFCRQTCVLFIITFISIIIYGLLSEINWMDGILIHFCPTCPYQW